MSITPVEIRHQQLRRGMFGYKRRVIDNLLEEIADSFELVWRERAELTDRVEQLDADLAKHVELEGLLRSTLISAERAAQEQRERARREADTIIGEAHAEARVVTREARAETERLASESRRITAMLRSALALVEDAEGGAGTKETTDETPRDAPAASPAASPSPLPSEIRRLAG
jgi:cell division initiation protein